MQWQGTKVVVTGADGFIGSHLTEALVARGADVRALCYYNSLGSLGWLDTVSADVRAELDIRLGDIRDAGFVDTLVEGSEVVFHLAALIAIPFSYIAPRSYVDTNVTGTLNVLESVRRHGVRRLIHTSTSEVYGTPDTLPIRETHPLRGQSPYSATKIAADKLCESYYCSFGAPVVVLRPFNTYGPRQSMRAVLPTIINQLLAGNTSVELGDLRPERDLTFVADTVEGFLAAAQATGVEGQVIQLGTGRSVSIGELFDITCKVLGKHATVRKDDARVRPPLSEVMVLRSDPQRAHELLGWQPRVTLEEGIALTAEWCERNLNRFNPELYYV